jgi:hypothetical protein
MVLISGGDEDLDLKEKLLAEEREIAVTLEAAIKEGNKILNGK